MKNPSWELSIFSVAVAMTFAVSAEAADPTSFYNFGLTLKGANQEKFINSMIGNYSKTVTVFSTLVTARNTALWGGQAWYQNIQNQLAWYQAELARYQVLKESLIAPPTTQLAQTQQSNTPAPGGRTIDAYHLPIGPNPQWYLGNTGGKITTEQLQVNTILGQVGVPGAWARGYTGAGSTVAIIDQGFNINHADIKANVVAYKNFYPGIISASNSDWGVHGTAMASVAAGVQNGGGGTIGVAPDAKLVLAQIGQGGSSPFVSTSAAAQALDWAQQQGAIAVNMSFSSTFDKNYIAGTPQIAPGVFQNNPAYSAMYGQTGSFNAFKGSINNSSVVLAAAGNQGLAYSGYPGAFATAVDTGGNLVFGGRWLIVGSVDAKNNLSAFSNAAGHICVNLQGGVCKDPYQVKDFYVVAPGERDLVAMSRSSSTAEATATVSTGTSPATAIVSGGVALIHQAWPQLKAADIVQLVKQTATDLGVPGVDSVYGYGLVNFDKATKPYGELKYSKAVLGITSDISGSGLAGTGLSAATTTALSSSEVLKNVQVVDSIGRNYAVNFSRAINSQNPAALSFTSPWLSMNPVNYKEQAVPFGKTGAVTLMQSDLGSAVQIDAGYPKGRFSFQFGTMREGSGFLNNTGSGLLALGGSSTSFFMAGADLPINYKFDWVFGYGLGFTRASNVSGSLIQLDPKIVSVTAKFGVSAKDVFLYSGKTRDKITLTVSSPVHVLRGGATISAITGYDYQVSGENVTAHPVTAVERINLAGGIRQVDYALGYTVNAGYANHLSINLIRQTSIAGQSGVDRSVLSAMYRKIF